jgi:hypothetical protein
MDSGDKVVMGSDRGPEIFLSYMFHIRSKLLKPNWSNMAFENGALGFEN